MSTTAASLTAEASPARRLEVLFEELAQLRGQRNAIDSRVVEIIAEVHRDELWGATGVRSIAASVAWKTGVTPRNAETVVAIAQRLDTFPRLAEGMRDGRLSLDQVGVIAERGADGSDEHYAELASAATVNQLRSAVKMEPRPQPGPSPQPQPEITKTEGATHTTWRIRLPRVKAATFDAAMRSHHDALIADWKRDHDSDDTAEDPDEQAPAFPNRVNAFLSLIEAGWDTDVAARPHGQHTTVVVHVDVDKPAALHLGPVLSDDERREVLCDTTCEVWFQRQGRVIGSGRATRTISRRLRRALEYRDRCCVVPGWLAWPSRHPWGRRRAHRTVQPDTALPISSPPAPQGR